MQVGYRPVLCGLGVKGLRMGEAGGGPAGQLSMAGNLACQGEDGASVSLRPPHPFALKGASGLGGGAGGGGVPSQLCSGDQGQMLDYSKKGNPGGTRGSS